MVLAAGLGTRLRPLTNERPKALVEIGGRTLLEITLTRLASFGVREVIINVHHYADLVIEYLKAKDNFGLQVEISREELLLDTGGGLKKAGWFFLQDPNRLDEPFILHNVDVVSTIDFQRIVKFHSELALSVVRRTGRIVRQANRPRPRTGNCPRHRQSASLRIFRHSGDFAAPAYQHDRRRCLLHYRNVSAPGRSG
jgi:choline kinase